MDNRQCDNCQYWVRDKSYPGHDKPLLQGECRNRSPQILIMDGYKGGAAGDTVWPRTKYDDCCGNWYPADICQ